MLIIANVAFAVSILYLTNSESEFTGLSVQIKHWNESLNYITIIIIIIIIIILLLLLLFYGCC
jgi:uncharacterized phage infection (PIP) family protein YhgE